MLLLFTGPIPNGGMEGLMGDKTAAGDFGAHEQTYAGFLTLFKWGTIASAILTAIVVVLIAS